jgi:hypothetical protein
VVERERLVKWQNGTKVHSMARAKLQARSRSFPVPRCGLEPKARARYGSGVQSSPPRATRESARQLVEDLWAEYRPSQRRVGIARSGPQPLQPGDHAPGRHRLGERRGRRGDDRRWPLMAGARRFASGAPICASVMRAPKCTAWPPASAATIPAARRAS